ncbi:MULTISPECIES: Abi family protein [Staphylococcus]|uniref:Abi family protein n=1 Tax=Staphylococcus TaxID=1279 RepID=UPI001AEC4013|nr:MULTISPECIES: Abi family protein [Staphylococcus]MCT1652050.1 Abi family protein [Staphylococcus saprophyticus]
MGYEIKFNLKYINFNTLFKNHLKLIEDFYKFKPYISKSHRIFLLKQRGLGFKDENNAHTIFQNIPYYRLINGFKDTILENRTEDYTGFYFEDLIDLYDFDREISLFLFKYIQIFEESLLATLSNEISWNIGYKQSDYLNKANYNLGRKTISGKSEQDILFQNIDKILDDNTIRPIVHYANIHKNIPPWILFQYMSFGDKKYIYKLCKEKVKNSILLHYFNTSNGNLKEFMVYSLNIMHCYRNCAAHGEVISNNSFLNLPKPIHKKAYINALNSKNYRYNQYNREIGINGIFSLVLVLNRLFRNRSTIKSQFTKELISIVDTFKNKNTGLFDKFSQNTRFPKNYKILLEDI